MLWVSYVVDKCVCTCKIDVFVGSILGQTESTTHESPRFKICVHHLLPTP